MFLNFSRSVLMFTDQSRAAGGVFGDPEALAATAITSGMVKVLERAYTDDGQYQTPSLETLAELSGGEVEQTVAALEAFADTTPGLSLGSDPQPMGEPQTEFREEDSAMSIAGREQWIPAGVMTTRNVGDEALRFVVSSLDLRSDVRTMPELGAAQLDRVGTRLAVASSGCGACGACGACGVCVICGEINAGAPAAAATAVTAVTALFLEAFDPEQRVALALEKATPPNGVRHFRKVLGELANPSTTAR